MRKSCLLPLAGLSLVLALLGCDRAPHGDAVNPLLGTWKIDASRSTGAMGQALQMGGERSIMEFRPDKVIAGGQVSTVTYEVDGDQIIATDAQGRGVVFTMDDPSHMSMETEAGELHFTRVE